VNVSTEELSTSDASPLTSPRIDYLVDDRREGLTVAERGEPVSIAVDRRESSAVRRAADCLEQDLADICGCSASVAATSVGARLVVGTVGVSPLIDEAIAHGLLDVSALRDGDGALRWEGFVIHATDEVLYVAGADRRGTVYGIYELAEAIGVSPWRWWADVPVRVREHVTVRRGVLVADWPSIRYRGVFLNDEEELDAWARAHTPDGTIGPAAYRRVFELILRLKGNYIWPAMHVSAFNADPENGRLADEMGIVVGTSHCDMLLRSNQNEWTPWTAARREHVEYDYSIPGANRDALREYWRGNVEQNGGYEVGWTVGMRGVHDSGFVTSAIDDDEVLSEHEKQRARVRLLEQVILDQRQILSDVLGADRARDSFQTFVPYKEVLPLYDAGLDVPDDVTIVWTDDNFGYVRRYPSETERARSGGHGLYYHSSYWSPPSRSYLFVSSMPLAHMKYELGKAYENGIRRLWVDNIGSLKPLELDMEFFLRYAWEVGKETTTADVLQFTAQWADRTFSGGHGRAVAEILTTSAQVTNVRKLEHLRSRVFSQTGYGDEAARRLATLRALYDRTNDLLAALPEPERDAFFQLVALRVHASYLVNAQFAYADRSALAYEQGKWRAADRYLALSREFDAHKRAMLHFYNQVMADGKWDGILTPEAFPPPTMALLPAARPALRVGGPGLGVVAWGEDRPVEHPHLDFWPGGTGTKWIEVFNTGAGSVDFAVTCDEWLEVVPASGSVDTEQRLTVRLKDPLGAAGRCGAIEVCGPSGGRTIAVTVAVHDAPVPAGSGRIEADGYIAIPAADADEWHSTPGSAWVELPYLGRHTGSLVGSRRAASDVDGVAGVGGGWVGYRLQLVTAGAHLAELHRFPSLSSVGRLRLAISVDDLPPVVIESPTTDEFRGAWAEAVVDEVERLRLRLPYLQAGPHVLRVHVVDANVAFSQLVVYTAAPVRTSLGPPPSARPGQHAPAAPDPDPGQVDLSVLDAIAREVYRTEPYRLAPPPVVYADRHYWDADTTFVRNRSVPQASLGAARYAASPDGRKDVITAFAPGPVLERGGVLAVEPERALGQTLDAYRTASLDEPSVSWTHTQAETDGGTGLAMHVDAPGRRWDDPLAAPGLHVRIDVTTPGTYHAWALVKFDGDDDDSCVLALDGTPQPATEQFCHGDLFSFGTQQIWLWAELSDLTIGTGRHTLSILARKAGLRVDRLYLTLGDERPPADADWPA
jgi:hypothetical protein